MDGKHRGTGSTSAAREVQRRKEKRRKIVNFAKEVGGKEGKNSVKGQSKEWLSKIKAN